MYNQPLIQSFQISESGFLTVQSEGFIPAGSSGGGSTPLNETEGAPSAGVDTVKQIDTFNLANEVYSVQSRAITLANGTPGLSTFQVQGESGYLNLQGSPEKVLELASAVSEFISTQ